MNYLSMNMCGLQPPDWCGVSWIIF